MKPIYIFKYLPLLFSISFLLKSCTIIIPPSPPYESDYPQNRNTYPYIDRQEKAYHKLYEKLKQDVFKKDMLNTLSYSRIPLKTSQVAEILELFPFDKGKLSALKLMALHIIDPQNNYRLVNSFTFISGRKDAEKILKLDKYKINDFNHYYSSGNRMSEVEFDQFIEAIKDTSFKDSKMSLIATASNNTYFTCSQCATIMNLFSFDDEKLEVLKLIAPMLIDRQNYHIILNSLAFLSSEEKAKSLLGVDDVRFR